jgi:hypothetical protein
MSNASGWDDRYRTAEFVWKTELNRFLPAEVAGLQPGRALDLACGEGRNAVWLSPTRVTRACGWELVGPSGADHGRQTRAGSDVPYVPSVPTWPRVGRRRL